MTIREEAPSDYREVENLTREAFWNEYVPGCDEHYLVNQMRSHPYFLPELAHVALDGEKIVGNIMYSKSHLKSPTGRGVETLTFGPLSVLPTYQRQGVGTALIRHTVELARSTGYSHIIIHGHPHNYVKHGFRGSKGFNIADMNGRFPLSLLVLELIPRTLEDGIWLFINPDLFQSDPAKLAEFDRTFPPKEESYQYTQELFSLISRSYVE